MNADGASRSSALVTVEASSFMTPLGFRPHVCRSPFHDPTGHSGTPHSGHWMEMNSSHLSASPGMAASVASSPTQPA